MVFSAEGLINEMTEPAIAIRDNRRVTLESMTEVEKIRFSKLGTFEAFTTSGGISTLPQTYRKILRNIDYKTIRYPGHCEKLKAVFDLGFADDKEIDVDGMAVSPRSVLKSLLNQRLNYGEPDIVLVRVIVEGKVKGRKRRHISEIIDYYDESSNLTAMMRCTAFPVAIIASMVASGKIDKTGVLPQEKIVDPEAFEAELKKRNIIVNRRWSK
jgi:lysine 6-dehydrogenase